MSLARADLPPEHPQNIPLAEWTEGWLTLSVCGHTDVTYLMMHDHEKRNRGWPVTRQEKIELLIAKGDVPSAGIGF